MVESRVGITKLSFIYETSLGGNISFPQYMLNICFVSEKILLLIFIRIILALKITQVTHDNLALRFLRNVIDRHLKLILSTISFFTTFILVSKNKINVFICVPRLHYQWWAWARSIRTP